MKTQAYWSWIDGEFTESPVLPLTAGGVQHGYGLFETIYAKNGHIHHLEKHLARLSAAADEVLLEFSSSRECITETIHSLLDKNGLLEARVKISLLAQDTDYLAAPLSSHIIIQALPYTRKEQSIRLCSLKASDFSCPLSRLKATSYMGYQRAKRHAQQQGADDALLMNEAGHFVECSTSNIFFFKQGTWYSPPLQHAGLKGIQHEVITDLINAAGLTLVKEDLKGMEWECAFICNSLIGMQAVSAIDEYQFPLTHPELSKLKRGLSGK